MSGQIAQGSPASAGSSGWYLARAHTAFQQVANRTGSSNTFLMVAVIVMFIICLLVMMASLSSSGGANDAAQDLLVKPAAPAPPQTAAPAPPQDTRLLPSFTPAVGSTVAEPKP